MSGSPHYISNLQVSTKQRSGQRVLSQVINVEVYKPLRIHPEYIYLTPGASFVVIITLTPKINVAYMWLLHFLKTLMFLGGGGGIGSPLEKLRIKLFPVPCASFVFNTGRILLAFLVVITTIWLYLCKEQMASEYFFFPLALC